MCVCKRGELTQPLGALHLVGGNKVVGVVDDALGEHLDEVDLDIDALVVAHLLLAEQLLPGGVERDGAVGVDDGHHEALAVVARLQARGGARGQAAAARGGHAALPLLVLGRERGPRQVARAAAVQDEVDVRVRVLLVVAVGRRPRLAGSAAAPSGSLALAAGAVVVPGLRVRKEGAVHAGWVPCRGRGLGRRRGGRRLRRQERGQGADRGRTRQRRVARHRGGGRGGGRAAARRRRRDAAGDRGHARAALWQHQGQTGETQLGDARQVVVGVDSATTATFEIIAECGRQVGRPCGPILCRVVRGQGGGGGGAQGEHGQRRSRLIYLHAPLGAVGP